MHPLTIEDILSQETREKIESYEQLGYYFVAFRALDETYFKYSEDSSSTTSSTTSKTSSREESNLSKSGSDVTKVASGWGSGMNGNGKITSNNGSTVKGGQNSPEIEEKSLAAASVDDASSSTRHENANDMTGKRKKGIVEIVEGHKEGVEGAGVGAVNVYLVVFGDGIISVWPALLSRKCIS